MQNPWVTEDYSLEELETPTLVLYLQREQHGNAILVKKEKKKDNSSTITLGQKPNCCFCCLMAEILAFIFQLRPSFK